MNHTKIVRLLFIMAIAGITSTQSLAMTSTSSNGTRLPTGQFITPLATPGAIYQALNPGLKDFPNYRVGQAVSEVLSPDHKILLILTSGFNRLYNNLSKRITRDSDEYIFVYDVNRRIPKKLQVIRVPNTFMGIAFSPSGRYFYVSGGGDDDVHVYARTKIGRWVKSGAPILLGHKSGNGIHTSAVAAGLAITRNGKRLVVANYYNDSISIIDLNRRKVISELDLRPGKNGGIPGTPGGEYPFWISIVGNSTAYVSSQRDREIDVVDISGEKPKLVKRIPLHGTPNKMLLDGAQSRLFVACDNSDSVIVIDTKTNKISTAIPTLAPPGDVVPTYDYRGVAPNSLALSPGEHQLYVTNGGTNSIAVIRLGGTTPKVIGLIPTGWYPQAVVAGYKQKQLYIVNSRSNPGPNPLHDVYQTRKIRPFASNQYILQLENAGFLTVPMPSLKNLSRLTQQVMANNGFDKRATPNDKEVMQVLHKKIKHIIYIIKENRTYDQILGDLPEGNGDPRLTEFGKKITPNLHEAARRFVTLDNFYVTGEVSGEGWPWSTEARESDVSVKTVPLAYAQRGLADDTFGLNRNIDIALSPRKRRLADPRTPRDPDLLPGTANVAGVDGPGGTFQQGYIWSAALRAGLTVRNYGMLEDTARYVPKSKDYIPLDRHPFVDHLRVAFPAYPALIPITDPYYRSFDPAFPDFYREKEWHREFSEFVKNGNLPALSLVWLPQDHMGEFKRAIDDVNTPELQQADNDYAVGKLISAVAHSVYHSDTLIFILEDDAQDGPDHVNAHRSTAYIVGPYVRHNAVISNYYTTVNMLRTIEDILGIDHLSIFDANSRPMTAVFNIKKSSWSFKAVPSQYLANTKLPIKFSAGIRVNAPKPKHPMRYWAKRTKRMDFSSEDKVNAYKFNRILWLGLMNGPYPTKRNGKDLRERRATLLRESIKKLSVMH